MPNDCTARIADSRPGPGPFTIKSASCIPIATAALIACSAARRGGKRSTLARAFEPGRAGAAPGNCVTLWIGNRHNRIIKGCKDMHLSAGKRSLGFFNSTFTACRSHTLCHTSSLILSIDNCLEDQPRPRNPVRQPLGGRNPSQPERSVDDHDYFLVPRRRPRPATVFFGPLRVREFVRVRCPRTGKFRRWRKPR